MGWIVTGATAVADRGVHCVTGREVDAAHLLVRRAALLDVAERIEAMAAQAAPARAPGDAEIGALALVATTTRFYAAQAGAGLEALAWVDSTSESERLRDCFPAGHPARPRLVPIDGGRR